MTIPNATIHIKDYRSVRNVQIFYELINGTSMAIHFLLPGERTFTNPSN